MDASIVEIPGLLQDKIVKTLTFSDEGLLIKKPQSFDQPVFIATENIAAYRMSITLTWGITVTFAIGRQYLIEIKDFQNNTHQVKLKSWYGMRRKAYYKAYCDIYHNLWTHYFSNMLNYYIDKYTIGQVFELAGVHFHTDGISWDKKNKLFWNEIALNNYRYYFMISNAQNPNQHKSCSFASDWNAFILQCLLKLIVNRYKDMAKA